jgi:hypothetical protein
MIWTLVLFLLIVLLIATLPLYPYSRNWGYLAASIVALLLVVFVVLIGLDYITIWYPWAPIDVEPVPEGSPIIEPPAD